MNLYVQHDARAIASLLNATELLCDSLILKHGDPMSVLASSHDGNPLGGGWLLDAETPGDQLVAWSGTLADGLFDRDPRNWMRQGRDAFASLCDELAGQLESHDRTLCFRPHARHVLNDVPSCLGFLRDRDSQPYSIALAPASMFEPTMLDRIEEHLQRQFESLGQRCSMLLLEDLQVASDADGLDRCDAVTLGEGLLPRDLVRDLIRANLPATTPVVIDGRQGSAAIAKQIDWLCG